MTKLDDWMANLKRLDEAATDGPWLATSFPVPDGPDQPNVIFERSADGKVVKDFFNLSAEDARVAAAARNALPVLLKMVDKALDLAADHETFNEFSEILDESENHEQT